MKISCKKHGIVEGRFRGHDLLCEVCLNEAGLLAMANMTEREADLVTRQAPVSMSVQVLRNVPEHEPDIAGPED